MKMTVRKLRQKIIFYQKHKHFSNDTFRDNLLEELPQVQISNNYNGFNNFLKNCQNIPDKLAPGKKVYRG